MWLTLALAILTGLVVLYVPGYFFGRASRLDHASSALVAPAFSLVIFAVLGIVLYKADVSCSGLALFALSLIVGLAAFLVSFVVNRTAAAPRISITGVDAIKTLKVAALYAIVALAMTTVVFLLAIDGPESFSRNDDTTVHLNVVRAFLDTGTYSTLAANSFLDQGVEGSFYPATWHIATAIVASLFGGNVTLATNAMIVATLAFVLPIGFGTLMLRVFGGGGQRRIVFAGAAVALAFSGFPWGFVVFGQLLPNMLSFSLIPLAMLLLMSAIDPVSAKSSEEGEREGRSLAGTRTVLVVALVFALVAIAFSQPNGAFTFGIWAVLYGIGRVFFQPDAARARFEKRRILIALAILVAACLAWAAAYFAPFMQGVVQNTWSATLSPAEAVVSGLMFMFTIRQGVQPFLSILVLVGVIWTCRNRRYLWMTIAYFAALIMYIISVSTDGVLKHVLTGFWYTDYNRTGAMAAFFAIPLAAIGFAQVVTWLQGLLLRGARKKALGATESMEQTLVSCSAEHETRGFASSAWPRDGKSPAARSTLVGATCVLVAVFLTCEFAPIHVKFSEKRDIYMGLVQIDRELSNRYSWENTLTSEEDAFIDEALDVIPDGALVINTPNDGSCWSYGVEGINVFYRRCSDTGSNENEHAAELLRTELCNVATSSEVQQTLDELDAHYLLALDTPRTEDSTVTSMRYTPEHWQGIESINDTTPGFKVLLSKGDMRLYEIVG